MERLFIVTNPMPTHNNSPAVSLGKFVQVVLGAGYSPRIIGARLPEKIPGVPDTVPVRSFRYGGKGIFKMLSFLLLQIKTFFYCLANCRKGDAVYFWIADKMIGAFLGAKLKGAEINYFLYGKVFADGDGGLSEKLVRFMMNRATYVCAEAPSVFGQWGVGDSYDRDSINLFVPQSGVTPIPFEERSLNVAMYCRLSIGKHIDDAIRAFCAVKERFPEYRLKIIGGGPIEADVRNLVRELRADGFITVTGWLDHGEALKTVADSRVLLYPTDAEGVPGGILEAMSLGVPALASPVGGIPDLIESDVDGMFLASPDADTIARELETVLATGTPQEMSRAAMRKIKEKFSLESAAANFKAVRAEHTDRQKGNN
ncbi:MAG: glycosyltransferase [Clostridia bacterium]|nr:glycosyltransferase [Clostridia bacterium]